MRAIFKTFMLLVSVLLLIGVSAALYVVQSGVSARGEPGAVETTIARGVRTVAIARRARSLLNPVERTPGVVAAGRAHFADHCAVCHANDGSGHTEMGQGMWPKPPDLRLPLTQNLSDGELFYIIEQGIRYTGMPGFGTGTKEGEEDSWRLVHFIRHLPGVSESELEEMEALNPRPPEEIRQEIEAERFLEGHDPTPAPPGTSDHAHP